MKRVLALLFFVALLAPGPIQAQVGGGSMEDVETLDGILDAYYEVVSRPAGTAPDRERDEWIHHPDALVAITGLGADGDPVIQTMTLAEYHDRFGAADAPAFFEWEVHRTVQRFGNVAHVWSTYASSGEPDGEVFGRGINSIQLYHDGSRWWITSWIFDQERAGNEIPPEFLPAEGTGP
ncbi:MAG: hypothetical protein M8861_06220 [marine benthic group bacterium]|nr:hypothetical protein [Gemmatimonadota bacterium]